MKVKYIRRRQYEVEKGTSAFKYSHKLLKISLEQLRRSARRSVFIGNNNLETKKKFEKQSQ